MNDIYSNENDHVTEILDLAGRIDSGFVTDQKAKENQLSTISDLQEFQLKNGLDALGLDNKTEYFTKRLRNLNISSKTFYRWWNVAEYAIKENVPISEKMLPTFMAIVDIAEEDRDRVYHEAVDQVNKIVPPAQLIRDKNKQLKLQKTNSSETDASKNSSKSPNESGYMEQHKLVKPSVEQMKEIKSVIKANDCNLLVDLQTILSEIIKHVPTTSEQEIVLGKTEINELVDFLAELLEEKTSYSKKAA